MKKNYWGPIFFTLTLAVMVFLSWEGVRNLHADGKGWARLEAGQARLSLRAYLFLQYKVKSPVYADQLRGLLQGAAEGWEKALDADPYNLDYRFALAIAQMEAGESFSRTLLTTPTAQKRTLRYRRLESLVSDPKPEAKLLAAPEISSFIQRNPTHRLWLSIIYYRLDRETEAERQLQLGAGESASYVISTMAVYLLWGLAGLAGLIIWFSFLLRKKVGVSSQETPGPDLAKATEGLLVWFVAQFILAAPILILLTLQGKQLGDFVVFEMLASFLAMLAAVSWVKFRCGHGLNLGAKRFSPFGRHFLFALAVFALSPVGMLLARFLQYYFNLESQEPSLLVISEAQSLPMRILVIVVACIFVPAAEETIFRGLIYRGLRNQWGPFAAAIISSLAFAVLHMDLLAALPIFIFGLGLAWSAERTGSLAPAIIAHSLFNLFPLLLLNLALY